MAADMRTKEIESEVQTEIKIEKNAPSSGKEANAVDSEQSMLDNGSDMNPDKVEIEATAPSPPILGESVDISPQSWEARGAGSERLQVEVIESHAQAADRPEETLSDNAIPETDAPEVAHEAAYGEEIDLSDEDSPESEDVIQGELALGETEGVPAPDIQMESHGRRLGLTMLLESLLFVSDEPVEASQLAKALNISIKQAEAGLKRLDTLYEATTRGLRVQVLEGRYQLVTAPETANAIEDFLNLDLTTKLSGPALETLAVVAYRQPATRAQIEAVRGVDCAGVLRSLGQRGLIEEAGRLDTVGRPILYGVTDLFMQHFGLLELDGLPPLETDDEDMLWAATKLAEMELEED